MMHDYLVYLPNYATGERRDVVRWEVMFAPKLSIWLDETYPGMQLWLLPSDVISTVEPEEVEALEVAPIQVQTPRYPTDRRRVKWFRVFEITSRGLFGNDTVHDTVYVPTDETLLVDEDTFSAAMSREDLEQLRFNG